MSRKRAVVGLALLVGLAVGVGVVALLLWRAPGVTLENFRRLRPGLTQPQVEAVLGRPADDPHLPVKTWEGNRLTVILRFALPADGAWRLEGGSATDLETDETEALGQVEPRESLLDRVRRLLRL